MYDEAEVVSRQPGFDGPHWAPTRTERSGRSAQRGSTGKSNNAEEASQAIVNVPAGAHHPPYAPPGVPPFHGYNGYY